MWHSLSSCVVVFIALVFVICVPSTRAGLDTIRAQPDPQQDPTLVALEFRSVLYAAPHDEEIVFAARLRRIPDKDTAGLRTDPEFLAVLRKAFPVYFRTTAGKPVLIKTLQRLPGQTVECKESQDRFEREQLAFRALDDRSTTIVPKLFGSWTDDCVMFAPKASRTGADLELDVTVDREQPRKCRFMMLEIPENAIALSTVLENLRAQASLNPRSISALLRKIVFPLTEQLHTHGWAHCNLLPKSIVLFSRGAAAAAPAAMHPPKFGRFARPALSPTAAPPPVDVANPDSYGVAVIGLGYATRLSASLEHVADFSANSGVPAGGWPADQLMPACAADAFAVVHAVCDAAVPPGRADPGLRSTYFQLCPTAARVAFPVTRSLGSWERDALAQKAVEAGMQRKAAGLAQGVIPQPPQSASEAAIALQSPIEMVMWTRHLCGYLELIEARVSKLPAIWIPGLNQDSWGPQMPAFPVDWLRQNVPDHPAFAAMRNPVTLAARTPIMIGSATPLGRVDPNWLMLSPEAREKKAKAAAGPVDLAGITALFPPVLAGVKIEYAAGPEVDPATGRSLNFEQQAELVKTRRAEAASSSSAAAASPPPAAVDAPPPSSAAAPSSPASASVPAAPTAEAASAPPASQKSWLPFKVWPFS